MSHWNFFARVLQVIYLCCISLSLLISTIVLIFQRYETSARSVHERLEKEAREE